ncbi:single-stranded DNA-binding protein [Mesonia sediminis]|uniref:Single-stranded DNA-binding protein n=1 Tax=Mesonia sediminis TaxID=1703946 RepID=A0ABW5SEF7_9FLAO
MNAFKNRIQLMGNLGNDPEIVNLETGKKLAKFSLATNETYKNARGEKVTDTQWHNVVAWGGVADIIENYCKKGNELMLQGKLTNRSYENAAGEKRYITEVVAQEVLLMGKKA